MHDDDPADVVHDAVRRGAVRRHARSGRPILGTRRVDQRADPRPDRTATTGAATAAENMVVAAAGNLDHDEVVRLVARGVRARPGSLGGDRRAGAAALGGPPRAGTLRASRVVRPDDRAGQPRPRRARPRPHRRAAVRARRAQRRARRRHVQSRLFQEIREKRGLAYSVYSYTSQYADTGLFGVYAGCLPAQDRRGARICRERARQGGRATASPTRSSSAARASCAARSCSAWRTPARG